jgi:hypothetical protein
VDNGSEFISRDVDQWAYANNVTLDFSRLGKPIDNGFIEANAPTPQADITSPLPLTIPAAQSASHRGQRQKL